MTNIYMYMYRDSQQFKGWRQKFPNTWGYCVPDMQGAKIGELGGVRWFII